MDELMDKWYYFCTPVYILHKPEFLDVVTKVSKKYHDQHIKKNKLNEIYPVYQTENFFHEPEMEEFSTLVGVQAWEILNSQGYHMDDKEMNFDSMWLQTHYKMSSMEYHTHGYGSQISGFYFVKCPEVCPKIVIHDPRVSKIQSELPEKNMSELSDCSRTIYFDPKPGMLFFTNSWVPHSFSRNESKDLFQFVHFNLYPTIRMTEELPIVI